MIKVVGDCNCSSVFVFFIFDNSPAFFAGVFNDLRVWFCRVADLVFYCLWFDCVHCFYPWLVIHLLIGYNVRHKLPHLLHWYNFLALLGPARRK